MAIIKSYSSGTLKLTDYLIASDLSTENVTRNFKVSEVVNTILAALNIGTVTSISTANSDFITLAGGPITTTGTLTASLSASGTPSTLTYLRGDGTWSQPGPTPTDISTAYNGFGNTLTTDTESWNFTGTGVTASATNNNITVDIPGLLATVDSVIDGIGITATGTTTTGPSTGDVTITNAGVTQLTAGNSVTLSALTGDVTISTRANAGTVIAVNEGRGIDVTNGNTNAIIDVDYAGLDNYIRSQPDEGQEDDWTDTSGQNDFIPFNQLTTGTVKTAKFNSIPNTALTSITSTVDTADDGKIKNIDTYTNVWKNTQVVTLTLAEYNSICPGVNCDNNTLYLILGPGTVYTVNLVYSGWTNVTLSSGGVAPASAYSILTEVDDGSGFVTASSITGIAGINYTFRTTITAINGYTLVSGPSGNTTSGTISGNATETQTITAVLDPPPVSNCVVTLNLIDGTTGVGAGQWGNFGAGNGATTTVPQGSQFNFNTSVYAIGSYIFGTGPFYNGSTSSGFSGTAPSAPTFTFNGTISGRIDLPTYSSTLTIDESRITGDTSYLSNLNWTITSASPSGQSNPITTNGGVQYGWNAPQESVSQPGGGTLTYTPDSSKPWEDSGGSAISWSGTMLTMPFTNTGFTAYPKGVLTFTPTPSNYEVNMNYAGSSPNYGITNTVGATLTFSPTPTAGSGQVAVGSQYTIPPGTGPTVTLSDNAFYFSTPVNFSNTNGKPLVGTESSSAGSPFTSDWSVTAGAVARKTVNISVSPSLSSNVTYTVVFTYNGGQTTATCVLSSASYSGATTVPVLNGSSISFTVTRQGASWCSSSFCPGGQLGYSPCGGSQYLCPSDVPQYIGGYAVTVNGLPFAGGILDRNWNSGSTVVSGSGGAITSLNQGDNIEIQINE